MIVFGLFILRRRLSIATIYLCKKGNLFIVMIQTLSTSVWPSTRSLLIIIGQAESTATTNTGQPVNALLYLTALDGVVNCIHHSAHVRI